MELTAEVTDKGEAREFEKFGKRGKVCTAILKDASGEVKLSLWNEQVDQVNLGDTVKITNGYVNEYQGEKQLTTGKFGKLEVLGKAEAAGKPTEAPRTNVPPEEDSSSEEEGSFDEDVVEEEVDGEKE